MKLADRDFLIVVGNQGMGKTVWTKQYLQGFARRFLYDPLAMYPGFDYAGLDRLDAEAADKHSPDTFSIGSPYYDDIQIMGNLAYAWGRCTYAIEECGTIFRRGELIPQWARRLIFMGRFPAVNLVLVAQRAASIPIDIRSQANRIITFRQHEPDDLSALRSTFGLEQCRLLPTLETLECMDWHNGEISRYRVQPKAA
jgi:hypothetical protein